MTQGASTEKVVKETRNQLALTESLGLSIGWNEVALKILSCRTLLDCAGGPSGERFWW
jgi:hypothetical protein